ncbi:MAG: hypothetical protein QT05_C0032G0010 [archaeon GW2011_AR13]|nr:MAG: hypothetical protein QT05_C0032G0010 [archaeon GW2011_AR13]HIG94194.1 hypothetical protein [Nanoarchaeota archaeon]HIH62696.1 hypothetical protein [Nanoarchaeota archaeon]HIJ09902.1 hypothetical protein [Nanoarchaeota archaeon]
MDSDIKVTKKIVYEFSKKDKLSKNDLKFLKLVKIAGEIVLKEDELLFKELAKY